ncbi:hypothetical protein [Streptomyces pacificus]|uniref:Secreted protein n=1 Tax=Streptomyces pacificus TaxID=2705029 RepID=A0A6A0ASP4_9ACTN|nr:hypothetical protein [Streptomyces pacificus]GFH35872.1 hypothetical protein SCWH03_20940 [Streptomyces pacificus]
MTTRKAFAAALLATVLPLSLTACGGGDGVSAKGEDSNSAPATTESANSENESANTVPDNSKTLATINGANGFQLVVHTAAREDGGFLTVTGSIRNTSGKRAVAPIEWNGQESQVRRTGRSLGGITLVDRVGKKRYYVLRDTEGYPLTTTGIFNVDAGATVDFFAQFPSPPDSTTKVDIQVPAMPTATIEIS